MKKFFANLRSVRVIGLTALLMLGACSEEPQESASISLAVDEKVVFKEMARGKATPKFELKHKALLDLAKGACGGGPEGLALLRSFLEKSYSMQNSAEIKIERKSAPAKGSKSLESKSNLNLSLRPGAYSCSELRPRASLKG